MNFAGLKLQMGGSGSVDNRPRDEREKDIAEPEAPAVVAAAVSPAETPETPQPQPET